MKKISKFLSENPRYKRFQKPLEAAEVCDAARSIACVPQGQYHAYNIISFREGLLTLACSSSAHAANLQSGQNQIIDQINQKIGRKAVVRIRFKIE